MPTQIGDFGYTAPADGYLGGISGLGGGVATLTRPGNLSALVFTPVSNANSAPDDQNAAQVCGPNGAIVRTTSGTASSVVTNQEGTTITYGDVSFTVNASGVTITIGSQTFAWNSSGVNFPVAITAPDLIVPNGSVNGHVHGGVQTGSGNTGSMTG